MFEVLTKDLMSKYQQDKLLADFLTNTNRAQCLVQPQHNALSFLPNPRNDNERRRRFLEPRCDPLGPSPLSIMRSSFQLDERYTKKKICGRGNHWSHWRTLTSWLIARTNGHDIVLGPSVKNAVGICVWSRRRHYSVKIRGSKSGGVSPFLQGFRVKTIKRSGFRISKAVSGRDT